MDTLIDNIGVVNCWACLAQGEIPTISSADGEILISLKQNHSSTRDYEVRLRKRLRERFPDTTFFFQAGQYHHPDFELRDFRRPSICRWSGATRPRTIRSPRSSRRGFRTSPEPPMFTFTR